MTSSFSNKLPAKSELRDQKNFFDYSIKEREEMMRNASDGAMKQQRALMKKYNKLKSSVSSYKQSTQPVGIDNWKV